MMILDPCRLMLGDPSAGPKRVFHRFNQDSPGHRSPRPRVAAVSDAVRDHLPGSRSARSARSGAVLGYRRDCGTLLLYSQSLPPLTHTSSITPVACRSPLSCFDYDLFDFALRGTDGGARDPTLSLAHKPRGHRLLRYSLHHLRAPADGPESLRPLHSLPSRMLRQIPPTLAAVRERPILYADYAGYLRSELAMGEGILFDRRPGAAFSTPLLAPLSSIDTSRGRGRTIGQIAPIISYEMMHPRSRLSNPVATAR